MKVSALYLLSSLSLYQAAGKVNISPEAEALCGTDAYCQINYEIRKSYEQDPANKDKVEECKNGKPIDYVYCLEKSAGSKQDSLDLERKVTDRFLECHEDKKKSNTTCTSNCNEDPLREGRECWNKFAYFSNSTWKDLDIKNHECMSKLKLKQNVDCRIKANEKYWKKMVNTKFVADGFTPSTKAETVEETKPEDNQDNSNSTDSNSNSTESKDSNSTDSKQDVTSTKGNGANQLISTIALPATVTILALLFV
ncbi:hypothetical protein CONCODRAFT_78536 [Conidiobolus coronatus NRRL 28638]|uniref:Uncharacterized protein n=1 Tax=Conidiobolus coronatus (strain ATCC 28846 / CBS 209.66 / NRRL 28638) TaxID=796925 RepID=A0A137P7Y5_CONC2|nr:hypothetical protein CONCODRAFT_78536 [Conidiobolus coronatus NRRL 28638]|eukprot:KXN71054.1 hypothetical protein CONCODRAFT_78536 [Conidiobolus coronatus NRRL 28638]